MCMHSQLCMSEIWNESRGHLSPSQETTLHQGRICTWVWAVYKGGSESVSAGLVVPQAGHDSGVSTCSIGQPSSSPPIHELITSRQRTLNSSCFLLITRILLVIHSPTHFWIFETPWTAARQVPLSSTISRTLLKCPLNWWCHLTISSSVVPFSSCLQSLPALGSFLMIWLFASGGQSIGASV